MHALRRRTLGRPGRARRAGRSSARVIYSPWLWTAQVLLDVAVVGLPAGAAQGRPPRAAGRPPGGPCRGPGGAADAVRPGAVPVLDEVVHETVAQERLPQLPHPSVPLAPVHALPRAASSWPARRLRSAGSTARWSVWTTTTSGSPTSTSTSRAAWPTPDQTLRRPALRRRPGGGAGEPGRYSRRLKGLWRSPVAHLVRIEGVRGSTPLSSTPSQHDPADAVGATAPAAFAFRSATVEAREESHDGAPRRQHDEPTPSSPRRRSPSRAPTTSASA